jgi:CheY-like chemotaxis protein
MPKAAVAKRFYDRESYIMVVDDDQTLLKFFKIHLNKFFSRVIVVSNAKEAIDTMKTKQIDLVLSDIKMPRVDGLQLMKKIRNQDASIPVYLISGTLIDDEMQTMIDEYSDGFLKKPFTVDEIHAFIDSGIKKREVLKELALLIDDNKKLLKLIKAKIKSPGLKDKAAAVKASSLLAQLKAE